MMNSTRNILKPLLILVSIVMSIQSCESTKKDEVKDAKESLMKIERQNEEMEEQMKKIEQELKRSINDSTGAFAFESLDMNTMISTDTLDSLTVNIIIAGYDSLQEKEVRYWQDNSAQKTNQP